MKGEEMKKRKVKKWLWGYFFIAPTIIGLLVLNIYPIIKTMILSFSQSTGFDEYIFAGLQNYVRVFQDREVWIGLRNTLVFSALSVPGGIFISLLLAWLMSKKIRGTSVYRVIYFTPMVAAPAAVALVWSWLYNTEFGALNQLLGNLGFQTHSWLNDPKYAMLSIVIIAIWGGMGQQIIILIVAITNVPKTYYEAAAIDGANGFVKLFKITVPLISPSVFFLTITGFIGSLTQFDLIYMLYGNNTSKAMDSVRTIMFQYYREAFVVQDKPYASAISIIALCVIMIFTAVQFAAQKKMVHYD